jgi:hypothetical protein
LAQQEPGFGVVFNTPPEVVELGRAWKQEAVFWVEDGIFHLLPCGDGESAVVGGWAELMQAESAAALLPK